MRFFQIEHASESPVSDAFVFVEIANTADYLVADFGAMVTGTDSEAAFVDGDEHVCIVGARAV